jgi:hypothetical protein
MVVYPLTPVIEPTWGYEPTFFEASVNLIAAISWLFLILTFVFRTKLRKYTYTSLFLCYVSLWTYFLIGDKSCSDYDMPFVILLTHLLCFLPLFSAHLLSSAEDAKQTYNLKRRMRKCGQKVFCVDIGVARDIMQFFVL